MCCCADATGRPQCNGQNCFTSLLRCMMSYKETRLFVFCFFKNPNKSLRGGSAARLASSSRAASPSHLLEDLLGDHILNSHFLHREQRSPSGEVGHSEVWWTQRLKQSWKKKTWSFLFSYFDLLIWKPYLLCGSVHKPSPLSPLTEPAPFHSAQLHSSLVPPCPPPSLPSTLCKLEKSTMLEAWSVLACFAKAPPAFGHFEPFNSLSF